MGCREYTYKTQCAPCLPCQRINLRDPVDLISEELNPVGKIVRICREYIQNVSSDPEGGSMKINIASVIVQLDQFLQDLIAVTLFPDPQVQRHLLEIHRAAQTIDTGNGTDNNDILPADQGGSRRQTQLIDLIIDG